MDKPTEAGTHITRACDIKVNQYRVTQAPETGESTPVDPAVDFEQ